MGLLTWVVIGVLSAIAVNYLRPVSGGGFFITLVMAIVGALVGGYICAVFNIGTLNTLDLRALFAALVGSVLFTFLFRKLRIS